MKMYRLVFSDPEHGLFVRWKRNKADVDLLLRHSKRNYAARNLMAQEYVEIPTDNKVEFIDWLNEHAARPPR